MRFFLRVCLPVLLVAAFFTAVPHKAHAQIGFLPFGGTIGLILPCANTAIYTIVISARNIDPLVPGPYIWTPATMTSITPPIPSIPPYMVTQQILGTFIYPWFCYIPPYIILWGFGMLTEGVSLI
jgi:hypothetical protein